MEQNQKPQCGAGVGPPCPVSALRSASRVQTKILIPTVLVKTQASYQTGGGRQEEEGEEEGRGEGRRGGEGRVAAFKRPEDTHARTHAHTPSHTMARHTRHVRESPHANTTIFFFCFSFFFFTKSL